MNELLPMDYCVNIDQLINAIKPTLKNNKWFFFTGEINGRNIRIKYFNKFLQVFDINGIRCGGSEYKTNKELLNFLKVQLS